MIPDRLGYFLDDFGNFENLVKIWTRRPLNYYQNIPKHIRKIWNHPGEILSLSICHSEQIENFRKCMSQVPCFLFKSNCEYLIYILYFTKMRTGKHKDWFNKIEKSLDVSFISIKNHEMEMWKILQTFLFSKKGIIQY